MTPRKGMISMENGNRNQRSILTSVIIVGVIIILCIVAFTAIPFLTVKKLADDSMNIDDNNYDTVITAVITENMVRHDEDGTTFYTPVYEYEYDGNTYRVPAGVSSAEKKYVEGQKVEIRISSHFPGRMTDPAFNSKTIFNKASRSITGVFLMVMIFPVIMLLVVIIIVIVLIRISKNKKTETVYTSSPQEENYDPNDDYRG